MKDIETDDDVNENNLLLESQSQEDSDSFYKSDHEPAPQHHVEDDSDSFYGSDHEPAPHVESITHTPPASPPKKQNRVQATPSIRNALEIAGELTGSPKGLLRYWKKGTQAQVKEHWDREIRPDELWKTMRHIRLQSRKGKPMLTKEKPQNFVRSDSGSVSKKQR